MINYRRIFKPAWLVPIVGVTLALMALAFWGRGSFGAEAANAGNTGIVGNSLIQVGGPVSGASTGLWTTILEGDIRTSQAEDVVYDVSLECGLYTDTLVRSKGGTADTSKAEASVKVRVLVDNVEAVPAHPGVVTFCSRSQTLMAKFGGVLNCTGVTLDTCTLTDEELRLILETLNANAFNFFTLNAAVGDHNIKVQAQVYTNAEFQAGGASAKAWVGKGTVAVDEVKFVKSTTMP